MIAMRDLARLLLARRVAHRHLGVQRPLAPRESGGLRSACCADNRGGAIGAVVQLRIVEHEVLATVILDAALEQPADDVIGLRKALVPLADARPALANDV